MKIALINVWSVINAKGGAEKVFSDMSNHLADDGHEVTAICCDDEKGEPGFPFSDKVRFINAEQYGVSIKILHRLCNIRSVFCRKSERKHRRLELMVPCFAYKLDKALKEVNPDVVVSFQLETTYAIKKLYGNKLPVVTMLHNTPDFYWLLDDFDDICDEGDIVQILMPEYRELVRRRSKKARIEYIPNTVPQFDSSVSYDSKKIIHVGRINKDQKRQHLLVEAFALIKDKYPDWTIDFYGETDRDPEYTRRIQALIDKNGLTDRVVMRGVTNNIPAKLLEASVFAFPSSREGFPLALSEAMSMGLVPVGCFEASSVNTLIRDGVNGRLCQSTPESIASALDRIMGDESLRREYGTNAKADMTIYSQESVMGRWMEILTDLVARKDL